MENPKFGENYRKDLADDLRALRNDGEKERAEDILEEEKKSKRYEAAGYAHDEEKAEVQQGFYLRNEIQRTKEKLQELKNKLKKINNPNLTSKQKANLTQNLEKSSGVKIHDMEVLDGKKEEGGATPEI